jgi:hypothetical protein
MRFVVLPAFIIAVRHTAVLVAQAHPMALVVLR